jgi:signal transduction histidine kinase
MEQVAADADSLAPEVQRVDAEATQRFDHLRAQLAAWSPPGPGSATPPGALRQARAILATADSLDLHLMHFSENERLAVRRLERFDLASALVLVPLALIAIGVVVWGGERVLHFARVAERERAEVVRSTEARAALLRGVTHDVKNPLGAASGYAHLLADGVAGELTDSQIDMVRRIQRLVDTSVRTVSDLVELARADGTPIHFDHVQTDLAELAEAVIDDHRGLARERGLTLTSELSPLPVVTDPVRVRQVLTNLLSNAIKYTPRGGTIHVQAVQVDDAGGSRVGIEVRDTGRGVPAALRERIFDEFVRGDSAAPSGNGVGLAISRRFARMLGGDVTYAPNEPCGAVFTLWLEASTAGPRFTALATARHGA